MNSFRPHGAMTIVAPIRPGHMKGLLGVLGQMVPPDHDVEDNDVLPFASTKTVHFARFILHSHALSATGEPREFPPVLVFSTNYDGPLATHLADIVDVAGQGLDRIFGHCVDYPPRPTPENRTQFLRSHAVEFGVFHHGAVGLSVERIRGEARLRNAIVDFLDTKSWVGREPAEVRNEIVDHLRGSGFEWALEAPDPVRSGVRVLDGINERRAARALLITVTILVAILFVVVLLFGLLPTLRVPWVLRGLLAAGLLTVAVAAILRFKEMRDEEFGSTQHHGETHELAEIEDKVVQNQISTVVDLKPGVFRRMTLTVVFVALESLARFKFRKGKLGSLSTIHFARWFYLDGGRSLAFYSNYDGSWESYLGDFVDKASVGLTAVWSNTVLYPRTRFLVKDGSRDEERFKVWARATQRSTQVWYSAYKTLTLDNILNNKEIRIGLSGDPSEERISAWLRRL